MRAMSPRRAGAPAVRPSASWPWWWPRAAAATVSRPTRRASRVLHPGRHHDTGSDVAGDLGSGRLGARRLDARRVDARHHGPELGHRADPAVDRRAGGRHADPRQARHLDRLAAGRRAHPEGHPGRPRRLQRPEHRQLPPVPDPAPRQRPGAQDRDVAGEPRRPRRLGGHLRLWRRVRVQQGAARPLRHRRLGSPGHVYTQPAIDCIDDYDKYYAGIDITPDTPRSASTNIDVAKELRGPLRREERGDPRSTSAPTTRPATWTRSAGRWARTRSATSGSATAASSGRRGRRCSPTPCGPPCSTAPSTRTPAAWSGIASSRRLRAHARRLPRRLRQATECAFHNEGHAGEAFDELMDEPRRQPDPDQGRPARPDPRDGAAGGRHGDVRRQPVGPAVRRPRRRPAGRRRRAARALGHATTTAPPTARGRTSSRRSRSSRAWTRRSARRSSEDDANALEIRRLAPGSRRAPPALRVHVVPAGRPPRIPITGAGAGPIVVIGTTGDPATPLAGTEAMAPRWRTAG